jgi:prolyl-tRNA synthetase
MNAIGGQELLMPVLNPAELWKRSGRYDAIGSELMKLEDRKGAPHVLAMTHEEIVTFHVANAVRSYRQLPMILYHFQIKERDEPRPRAGVLRTREFIMKDAYSFDVDEEGLAASYDAHAGAYARMLDRSGIRWYAVESDVGMMGGSGAHEYMAPCAAGENDVALAPGYAANVEIASAEPRPVPHTPLIGELETPGLTTIADVAAHVGADTGQLLRAFAVVTESRGLVMVFLRGDHQVNEIKLRNALGEDFRPAREDELRAPAGFLGPTDDVPSLYDAAVVPGPYVAGANRPGLHVVVDVPAGERVDVRTVVAGDTVGGRPITIEPAIEVGNIFKLGTRYTEPLGATYLDTGGQERPIIMGSYGIGPARIAAAAVEQFADERGISWPRAIAPWDVHVVTAAKPGTDEARAAEDLTKTLETIGLDVLLDDRAAGPGEKFADAELLGVPLRLTVGKRGLAAGAAESVLRRGMQAQDGVPLDDPIEAVRAQWLAAP